MIARLLPLTGALLLLAVVGCWRPWLQRRRYGAAGIVLFSGGAGQKVRDALGLLLVLCIVGQAIAAAVWPRALSRLDPRSPTVAGIWQVTGAVLLFGGLAFLVIAQLHLGASWRIGIDEGGRPGLVTTGVYHFCRNPIFLALLVTLTGYTLLLPTRLSLVLLLGAFIGIRQQVLAEEAYLMRAYGTAYGDYAARVGRFLPLTGRLR